MDKMRINISSLRELRWQYFHTFVTVSFESVTPSLVQVQDFGRNRVGYIYLFFPPHHQQENIYFVLFYSQI